MKIITWNSFYELIARFNKTKSEKTRDYHFILAFSQYVQKLLHTPLVKKRPELTQVLGSESKVKYYKNPQ